VNDNFKRMFLGSMSRACPASAKAGSLAPWDTRPAERTSQFSIIVSHGSSPPSLSRAATGAMPNCCAMRKELASLLKLLINECGATLAKTKEADDE
jgi:hypothetical protein